MKRRARAGIFEGLRNSNDANAYVDHDQPNFSHDYQESLSSPHASIAALIQLDRGRDIPLYKQIYNALRDAIITGALAEGTRLPTERALARALGVNRTTVMNAYNILASEDLIEGHVGRGTLVKRSCYNPTDDDAYVEETPSWLFQLPTNEEALLGNDARLMSDLTSLGGHKEIISFSMAAPEPAHFPSSTLNELLVDGLARDQQSLLDYCPVEGLHTLREGIAARMRTKGVRVDLRNILILSGSTQGIGLVGRMLFSPGDEVVVEVPTYLGAIQTFRALGARVIGVPIDNEGIRIDLLESILSRRNPRLIYVQSNFQNPTGAVMSLERRQRLLLLARRHQIPILEDDPYGEVYFEGKAPQSLKALDTRGDVVYLSTYSKIIAPGLRVAWLAAAEPMIERLSLHKQIFDLNTGTLGQWVIAEMIQRGMLDDHLQQLRQNYRRKRDLTLQAITRYWPSQVRVNRPAGGFHLWCRLPGNIRARSLLRETVQDRVTFIIGEPFHVDGGGHYSFRLSFSAPPEQYIETGIQCIGEAMQRLQSQRPSRDDRNSSHIDRLPMI